MPELVLKLGDNVLHSYTFDKDLMSIGRSRDNDIVVENLSVSRNHARIRRQNGKFILTDLNSANGTYVNGVRVSKTEIVHDDIITIGKHKLCFSNQVAKDDSSRLGGVETDCTVVVDLSAKPVLCITEGKLKGQEFSLTKFETSIGKAPGNDIVLGDDWFLGKKQAVIVRRGNSEYEIHDMGGIRKTRVNGEQLEEPRVLKPGDVIEFHNTKCVFQLSSDAPVASGRLPQEMSLEDSIFASSGAYQGVGTLPNNSSDLETPFADDVREELAAEEQGASNDAFAAFDSASLLQEALAGDESEKGTLPIPPPLAEPERGPFDSDFKLRGEALLPVEERASEVADEAVPAENYGHVAGNGSAVEDLTEPLRLDESEAGAEVENYAAATDQQESDGEPEPIDENGAEPVVNAAQSAEVSSSGGRLSRKKRREQQRQKQSPRGAALSAQNSDEAREVAPEPEPIIVGAAAEGSINLADAVTGSPDLATEIALWEAALNNKSPVIRKQAVKMLKKLTGRDYEA